MEDLDAWAISITSIPLRHPKNANNKKRKKYFRPGHTEPGICHNHYWIKETLNKTAKKALKHSLVTLSSSKRKYSSCYKKPGGAMIIAHGRTRGRITTYGNDDYGRWSWMRLNSKLGGIMVLSAYQVGN